MPLPSTSAITLPVAAPVAAAPAPAAGGDDTPFARMLSDEQRAASRDDADAAPHDTSRTTSSRAQPSRRATSRDGAARGAQAPADAKDTAESLPGDADKPQATDKHDDSTTADPALAGWIAGLHPAAPPTERPADTGAAIGSHGRTGASEALAIDGAASRPAVAGANLRADKAAERDTGQRTALMIESEGTARAHGDALVAAADEAASHAPRFELPKLHELSAAAGPTHAEQRAEPGAAPIVVDVATPVASPQFREALGVQVSVLARDGVQHAELHLNPADMGPISVQIALDGTRAQVDFGAASATTRHAIEAGLPELAAALRDAGFTLAGGGVSQHAGGRSPQRDAASDGGQRAAKRVDAAGDTAAPRRVSVRLPQGAVDLYA